MSDLVALCLSDAPSPFGAVAVAEENGAITRLTWPAPEGLAAAHSKLALEAGAQLEAYLRGQRRQFDLPLAPKGGAFEQGVWAAMRAIPFGETRTYGEIAKRLGSAAQPVGNACGANPLPILIPCHRVLGASGLGGFSASGGIEDKVWLLRHEGAAGLLI